MEPYSRRDFIKKAALATGFVSNLGFSSSVFSPINYNAVKPLEVSIFSKHLQFLDYETLGAKAHEMGFSGVDLTVRPGGHVEPSNLKVDLPLAIKGIINGGSKCNMITTQIESVERRLDLNILQEASRQGIKYYRTNWFNYDYELGMVETLKKYNGQLLDLARINKSLGLVGCYQNHAGTKIGASFWEVYQLLENIDSSYFGVQFDIRHATVEGFNSWKNAFELLKSKVRTMVLKDFKWVEINGKWQIMNVPLGKGVVDFKSFFKLLKKYDLRPPVSLHVEYDLGGAEKGKREISINEELVYQAMKTDLKTLQTLWEKA
ncbi:sugar phosphate isomerase/epimerase family protein [Cognatitamlana onchidii]|uniref:sugar phosphate isomerase/epimerase family protein n=1 Tax=Cognatitamlana onchidii TaxID=2562860 RepID=UPI0010A6AC0A|nr:TIM barrel protein [Algibacter onchidii]